MTDLLLLVLLRLVLDNVDLLALAVLNDICNNGCAINIRSAYDKTCIAGNSKQFVKCNLVAFVHVELLNKENVALVDLVLLSACFDNCKHEKHLTFIYDSLNKGRRIHALKKAQFHAANYYTIIKMELSILFLKNLHIFYTPAFGIKTYTEKGRISFRKNKEDTMATFFNQATLSYNNNVTASNIVTGELLEVLTATKTAVRETYAAGDTVTYVISLLNSGTVPYTGLTLTDDLGAYPIGTGTAVPLTYVAGAIRYYINGVLQAAPTVGDTSPLAVTGITVPAGGNALLVYSTTVNGTAPLAEDGTITNTVTVTGGGITTPITATEIITAAAEPRLTITKALSPATVIAGGQITYTLTIANYGNTAAVATDNLIVTDGFDPALTLQQVTLDGTALAEGVDYTYVPATGAFATVAGRITVPAATYTQDPTTGQISVEPGIAVLTVTGTI